jgi:hypothetical protein
MICALEHEHILKEVLACIGPGCYALMGSVNKQWKALTVSEYGPFTYYKCALSSAAWLTQALAAGLDLNSKLIGRLAGRHCDAQVLDVAHSLGLEWSNSITLGSASDLPKLNFLVEERQCPMHAGAVSLAACKSNSVDTLQWLQSLGEQFTEDHFCRAAQHSSMAVMHFLYANRCRPTTAVALAAAACQSAEPLQWLLHHTSLVLNTYKTSLAAACGGSVAVLQFLQPLVYWSPQMLIELLQAAGAHRKLAAAQWLRQQGAAWPALLQYNCKKWDGECLQWARHEGCNSPTWSTLLLNVG